MKFKKYTLSTTDQNWVEKLLADVKNYDSLEDLVNRTRYSTSHLEGVDQRLISIIQQFHGGSIDLVEIYNIPRKVDNEILSILFASLFGNVVRFLDEGDYIVEIKASIVESNQPSFRNQLRFPLHTDLTYVNSPPRYILMHGIHSDSNIFGGESLFCSVNDLLADLPIDVRRELQREQFIFSIPSHYTGKPIKEKSILMYNPKNDQYFVRFRQDTISCTNQSGKDAIEKLIACLDDHTVKYSITSNSILIFDNYRCLHGREQIKESGVRKRILHRVYVNKY